MFSHMRRVSPLHSSERQRSEVKPIMASKEDGDIRSAEVDKAHVAMGTENGGVTVAWHSHLQYSDILVCNAIKSCRHKSYFKENSIN